MMIQILIPSGRTRLATLSQPLGRKGKHTCFSKADAKVQLFFHICKYFTKKHAFLYNFAQVVLHEYSKHPILNHRTTP